MNEWSEVAIHFCDIFISLKQFTIMSVIRLRAATATLSLMCAKDTRKNKTAIANWTPMIPASTVPHGFNWRVTGRDAATFGG